MSHTNWIREYLHQDVESDQIPLILETIINSSYDGFWVCDGRGVVIAINRAAEKMIGLNRRDILGRNISELVETGRVDRTVTPEVLDKKKVVSRIQLIQETGKRLLVTGTPVFDDHGQIYLVVTNERDLTLYDQILEELNSTREKEEKLREELDRLNRIIDLNDSFICESREMRDAVRTALTLAGYGESNILVLGESGTGKGLLARLIHENSPRRDRPFVHINCAALPESLLEAELFGYERGAFTGARNQGKAGLFEVADGGSIFLDEIGEMPLRIQSKILTYLDNGEITRLGGTKVKRIDCSVIAATNQDIETMVEAKQFRNDLFYRLNSFSIAIPPLRKRPEDIFELTKYFIDHYNTKYGLAKRIGNHAMGHLATYRFPGNIRELKNIIKRSVALSPDDYIDRMVVEAIRTEGEDLPDIELEESPQMDLTEALNSFERVILAKAMKSCRTTRELAQRLNVSQATVVRKMKRAGLSFGRTKGN